MSRSADQRILDILDAAERCQRYLRVFDGTPDESLRAMAEDALERNLQIIGEAANRLPRTITDRHAEIPWSQIRGFRNILVHRYFGVDAAVVRDVIENHLPPLCAALRAHVSNAD